MSHFSHIKTRFQNLGYLEKALERLNIVHQQEKAPTTTSLGSTTNLVIPQSNGYDLKFVWNGEEYEFVVDLSFWEQASPVESFMDQVAQQYASEVVIGEGQSIGFEPIHYATTVDGANTIVLERWNAN
jgi:hypothetical protein